MTTPNKYETACEAYEAAMEAAGYFSADDDVDYYMAHTLAIAAAVDAAEKAERE